MSNKYKIWGAIAFILMVIALISSVFYVQNQKKKISDLQSRITQIQIEKKNLQNKNMQIKNEQIEKYSANNLNKASMNVKPNVDNFFDSVYNWSGQSWAERPEKAQKYATDKVVNTFLGLPNKVDKADLKKQAKGYEQNNVSQKVVESHWYIEKSDGRVVDGLYIVSTEKDVGDDTNNKQKQFFRVEYDVLSNKITKINPIDLNSNEASLE